MQADYSRSGLVRIFKDVLPESVLQKVVGEAHALADSPNYWMTKVGRCTDLSLAWFPHSSMQSKAETRRPFETLCHAWRKQSLEEGPTSLQQKRPYNTCMDTSISSCQRILRVLSTGFRSTSYQCSAKHATILVRSLF